MVNHEEILAKAIAARAAFLKEYPGMQKYQDEIDEMLDKTPPEYRAEALSIMVSTKALELSEQLMRLNTILSGVNKNGGK